MTSVFENDFKEVFLTFIILENFHPVLKILEILLTIIVKYILSLL